MVHKPPRLLLAIWWKNFQPKVSIFFNRNSIIYLSAIYWLSRIPFLSFGYGSDADSWRVIENGLEFLINNNYIWSRFPGYPLYELPIYLIADKGPIVTNTLTALIGFFCMMIFRKIIRHHLGLGNDIANITSLIFCFIPVIWNASTITMDYLFSELFLLISWYLIKDEGRLELSSISLGIAVGFRPNNGIFIIPIIIGLLLFNQKYNLTGKKSLLRCIYYFGLFCVSSFISMLPVYLNYDILLSLGSISTWDSISTWTYYLIAGYHILELMGVIGGFAFSALIIYLVISNKSSPRLCFNFSTDPSLMISILGIGINFILYSFFPFESFYLIPSIPFLLYMVLKFAYINQEIYGLNLRKVFGMLLLIIFINGFIDINLWKRNSAGKMSISKPFIGHGFVLADFYKRKSLLNEAQYLLTEGNFNRPCLILSGWHYAIIRVQKNYILRIETAIVKLLRL